MAKANSSSKMGSSCSKVNADSDRAPTTTHTLPQSNPSSTNIWNATRVNVQPSGSSSGFETERHRYASSNALDRATARQNINTSEQISQVDNVARLFHVLSQHYRTIVVELTKQHENTGTQKIEQALTSAFGVVLQFCELITLSVGREEVWNDTSYLLAVFSNTTISVMTAKTVIDLYDLVLEAFERSLGSSTNTDKDTESHRQRERVSGENSPHASDYVRDMDRVLKTCEQMETMDFHIVHLEAVCRKFRDLAWKTNRDISPQNTMADGSTAGTNYSPIPLSQNEAIDRLLNAATSTRQEIRRLRTIVHSSGAMIQ